MKTVAPMLNPCPFCGADSSYIHASPHGIIATWVECTQCGAHSKTFVMNKADATKAASAMWNRRASTKLGG